MNPMTLLNDTQDRAAAVISQIRADRLGLASPCTGWDVRTCLNKLITSTRFWVVSLTEGRADPQLDLGAPLDLIGDDPSTAYKAAAAACQQAFALDGILTASVPAPVPGVSLTGEQMLGVRIFDTTVITWDLARAVGVAHGITEDQARFAHQVADIVIPLVAQAPDRSRFQPATTPPDNATEVDKLIAATGRDPMWQPV
jgi:uncharacterized protein (TIGR03086 family)